MASTSLYCVLFVLLVVQTIRGVQTYLTLRQFSGHCSFGGSRLWLLKTQRSGQMNRRFTEFNKRFGKFTSFMYRVVYNLLLLTTAFLMLTFTIEGTLFPSQTSARMPMSASE